MTSCGMPAVVPVTQVEVGALGVVQRDRALVREDERGAGQHAADGERGDEGGDLEPDVGEAGQRPGDGADEDGEDEASRSRGGSTVSATMTLASEAMDWIERSIPPSMMTKVTPVARTNRVAVSPPSWSSVAGARNSGWSEPTIATRTTSVTTGIHRRSRSRSRRAVSAVATGAQTMCPMRATWSGLPPARRLEALGDRAVAHDQDGVAEADRLLQRVGGQDHRHAVGRDGAHEVVDLLLGAHVEAAGRVVEDQDARARVQPLGQHDLLLVAAREVEAERVDDGRADVQALDPLARRGRAPCEPSIRPKRCELVEAGERDVGGDREEEHEALGAPLARDVADAAVDGLGGVAEAAAALPKTASSPASCGAKPASVRASSSRPEPMTPAMPRISPAWRSKTDVAVGALAAEPFGARARPRRGKASVTARGNTRPGDRGRPSAGAACGRRRSAAGSSATTAPSFMT